MQSQLELLTFLADLSLSLVHEALYAHDFDSIAQMLGEGKTLEEIKSKIIYDYAL